MSESMRSTLLVVGAVWTVIGAIWAFAMWTTSSGGYESNSFARNVAYLSPLLGIALLVIALAS